MTYGTLAIEMSQTLSMILVLCQTGFTLNAWIGLFSDDPQVMAMGTLYLRIVAPVYGAIGLGLALYFAGQGAKRVLFPVLAGTVRMIAAGLVGWSAVTWYGASLSTLFQIVALAAVAYGGLTAAAILWRGWGQRAVNPSLVQIDPKG